MEGKRIRKGEKVEGPREWRLAIGCKLDIIRGRWIGGKGRRKRKEKGEKGGKNILTGRTVTVD